MHYYKGNLKNDNGFALFGPPKMGNLMTPANSAYPKLQTHTQLLYDSPKPNQATAMTNQYMGYPPWNEASKFAPEYQWLEDDPASFWGNLGLFSGANLLLVSGRLSN